MRKKTPKIAVIDAETDPFLYDRIPKPFCWGFYDGEKYLEFWGDDCTKVLLEYLQDIDDELLIYAHNGGKFDFLYFIEKFTGKIRIVNGRVQEAFFDKHTFRDSYCILPVSLDSMGTGKLKIDYQKMERNVREKHKEEILAYLKMDCIALRDAIMAFQEEFGNILTIGSAAMKQLRTRHEFEKLNQRNDQFMRNYYFGGRCQCFASGIIEKPKITVHDANSMYPWAMATIKHPVSNRPAITKKITSDTYFVCWEGENNNAVPMRNKDNNSLMFNVEYGVFWTSIYEFNAALEWGIIKPKRIIHCVNFEVGMVFDEFVEHFYSSRKIADKNGDIMKKLFYKLILNSPYGKLAQNPEHYVTSIILPWGEIPSDPEYFIEYRHDEYAIWSKPAIQHSYYNVATAASITGASRTNLLIGLQNSIEPLYCDTDSIFATDFHGEVDNTKLGAWKCEATGNRMAIAGKKLYALMDGDIVVKQASKGARLTADQIVRIAQGEVINVKNDAPSFKLGIPKHQTKTTQFSHSFISRDIRMTA